MRVSKFEPQGLEKKILDLAVRKGWKVYETNSEWVHYSDDGTNHGSDGRKFLCFFDDQPPSFSFDENTNDGTDGCMLEDFKDCLSELPDAEPAKNKFSKQIVDKPFEP